MAHKKLTRIGENYWGHIVYKDENGKFYLDISNGNGEPNICDCHPSNDPDGEPGWPIEDYEIVNPITDKERREMNFRFEYMMLSRLKDDCDGFLSNGDCRFHDPRKIWGTSVKSHIQKMKELWDKIPEDIKPEWLTFEQILDYESRMTAEGPNIAMTRQELDAIYLDAQSRWPQPHKSKPCRLVLLLMDSEGFANNYCGALAEVLREYPETNREELERELEKYV